MPNPTGFDRTQNYYSSHHTRNLHRLADALDGLLETSGQAPTYITGATDP